MKYLVNSAGLGIVAPVLDTNLDEGRKLFEVNYWGALAMIQAFIPFIVQAKGTIANVGSGAGNVTIPWVGMFLPHRPHAIGVLISKRCLRLLQGSIPIPFGSPPSRSGATWC